MRHRYLAMDIEIASEMPDGMDWDAAPPLGISCIATQLEGEPPVVWFSQHHGRPAPRMTIEGVAKVIVYLQEQAQQGRTILTWNGLKFDFNILGQESGLTEPCENLAVSHVDMMFHIFCALGYPLSLDAAAKGIGLPGKPAGINGALAPRLWQAGEFDNVLGYVANDVGLTLGVARACQERRCLCWTSKRGRSMQLDLPGGWLTVREASQLPLPDTSRMDTPIPRSDFGRWLRQPVGS
jgi:RNase_H superfamily